MADWTPQQLQQMNAVVMGTHDNLTPGGQIQPGYTLDQIYGGILPAAAKPPVVANNVNAPTQAQLAAMRAVPSGSYQRPPAIPISNPTIPTGSQYQDTGNYGRATPAMQQLIQLAGSSPGIRPPWTIPQAPAAPQMPNVPLPRPRPPNAPNWMDMAAINAPPPAPVGANPGMGGAMFGDGVMSPQIPPQQPPADGSGTALPVWAGDNPQQQRPQQQGGDWWGGTAQRANGTNGYIYGRAAGGPWHQQGSNRAPGIGPAQQYASANLMAQVNARNRQANATGQAGGYQYLNGQRVGYAPQTLASGQTYTPTNGADAYGLANLAGRIAALNRQSNATGVGTNGYSYQNGVNMGYSQQEQAARAARGEAIGEANRNDPNPTYNVSGDNNSFQPQSVQNSERWQTGY